MISFLVTAWKEEKTIGKCIQCLCDTEYSGLDEDFEILLASPDEATYNAAFEVIKTLKIENKFRYIKDPKKGKLNALNMLFESAKGDIWILTDGDVYFGENAVRRLLKPFNDQRVQLVSGRPVSADSKNYMMGYFGHLLADAANHKRMIDLTDLPGGKSTRIIKKRPFFPVSGYIYATRKTTVRFPVDCLVDDAYISYVVHNGGGKITYASKALAYVKYPKTLKDYFIQKKRSAGGFVQLWKYGVVKNETKTRTFWRELEYFWFPIKYASSIKEYFWSLMLYPVRTIQWFMILWEQKILHKDYSAVWGRVESTK